MKNIPNEINEIFIFCAPYSEYARQPKGYSPSELVDCPVCSLKMWLSEKKKKIIEQHKDKKINLSCFNCFKREAINNPVRFMTLPNIEI